MSSKFMLFWNKTGLDFRWVADLRQCLTGMYFNIFFNIKISALCVLEHTVNGKC